MGQVGVDTRAGGARISGGGRCFQIGFHMSRRSFTRPAPSGSDGSKVIRNRALGALEADVLDMGWLGTKVSFDNVVVGDRPLQ